MTQNNSESTQKIAGTIEWIHNESLIAMPTQTDKETNNEKKNHEFSIYHTEIEKKYPEKFILDLKHDLINLCFLIAGIEKTGQILMGTAYFLSSDILIGAYHTIAQANSDVTFYLLPQDMTQNQILNDARKITSNGIEIIPIHKTNNRKEFPHLVRDRVVNEYGNDNKVCSDATAIDGAIFLVTTENKHKGCFALPFELPTDKGDVDVMIGHHSGKVMGDKAQAFDKNELWKLKEGIKAQVNHDSNITHEIMTNIKSEVTKYFKTSNGQLQYNFGQAKIKEGLQNIKSNGKWIEGNTGLDVSYLKTGIGFHTVSTLGGGSGGCVIDLANPWIETTHKTERGGKFINVVGSHVGNWTLHYNTFILAYSILFVSLYFYPKYQWYLAANDNDKVDRQSILQTILQSKVAWPSILVYCTRVRKFMTENKNDILECLDILQQNIQKINKNDSNTNFNLIHEFESPKFKEFWTNMIDIIINENDIFNHGGSNDNKNESNETNDDKDDSDNDKDKDDDKNDRHKHKHHQPTKNNNNQNNQENNDSSNDCHQDSTGGVPYVY